MINQGRSALAVAAAAIVAVGGAAEASSHHVAKTKHKRVQKLTFNYAGSESIRTVGPAGQFCVSEGDVDAFAPCFDFAVPSWAKYLTITSNDATGQPVSLHWTTSQGEGVHQNVPTTFACGSTKNAVVTPSSALTLSVDQVSAVPDCPGPATRGTVTILLSNRR